MVGYTEEDVPTYSEASRAAAANSVTGAEDGVVMLKFLIKFKIIIILKFLYFSNSKKIVYNDIYFYN